MKQEMNDAERARLAEEARLEALRLNMQNASDEEKNQLRLLNQAAARWKNSKMSAVWNTWRDGYLQYLYYLKILRKSHARWANQKLSMAFQKWYSVTDFETGKPIKVRLVVQDMKPIKPKGSYLARGSRYGIAVAEAVHNAHYEYASKVAGSRDELRLQHDLSPGRNRQHTVTPRGHGVIRSSSPRGNQSPRLSPPRSPRVNETGGRGEIMLLKSTETSLCVAWIATGKAPHTLSLGGKPIAVLDPLKDQRNKQLCFTVTHLKPLRQYHLSVDVGGKPSVFQGDFQTTTSTQTRSGGRGKHAIPAVQGMDQVDRRQGALSARTPGSRSSRLAETEYPDSPEGSSAFPMSSSQTPRANSPSRSGSKTARTPRSSTSVGEPTRKKTPTPKSTYSPSTTKLY